MTRASAQEYVARSQQATERITVALISRAAADLERLQARAGLSKTDIVNRAITLYEFIDEQMDAGRDVLLRDRKTQEIQLVRFF
jgi:hypothetical protein